MRINNCRACCSASPSHHSVLSDTGVFNKWAEQGIGQKRYLHQLRLDLIGSLVVCLQLVVNSLEVPIQLLVPLPLLNHLRAVTHLSSLQHQRNYRAGVLVVPQ